MSLLNFFNRFDHLSGTKKSLAAFFMLILSTTLGSLIFGFLTYYTIRSRVPFVPGVTGAIGDDCNCTDEPAPCPNTPFCEPVECIEEHPYFPTREDLSRCDSLCPPPPNCKEENCKSVLKCPSIEPPKEEAIPLNETEITNTNALKYIDQHPLNSPKRLQAATNILELIIEPYIKTMTRRNCEHAAKVCPICQDRYVWLRCVVNNRLVGSKFPEKTKLFAAFDRDPITGPHLSKLRFASDAFNTQQTKAEIHKKEKNLPQIKYPLDEKSYLDLRDTRETLWFITDQGKECTICNELTDIKTNHIECIANGYDYPWIFKWAQINNDTFRMEL